MRATISALVLTGILSLVALAEDPWPPSDWPPVVTEPALRTDVSEPEVQRSLEIIATCQGHFEAQAYLMGLAMADLDVFKAQTSGLTEDNLKTLADMKGAMGQIMSGSESLAEGHKTTRAKVLTKIEGLDAVQPEANYSAAKAMWTQWHQKRGGVQFGLASFDGSPICENTEMGLTVILSIEEN